MPPSTFGIHVVSTIMGLILAIIFCAWSVILRGRPQSEAGKIIVRTIVMFVLMGLLAILASN